MKDSYFIDYVAYMATLASSHVELNHSKDDKHFCRGELQDFFASSRSAIKYPCVILEGCELKYDGNSTNVIKTRESSFIVSDAYKEKDDYDEIQNALSRCERIGEEIIGKMINDAQNDESDFIGISISNIEAVYLQNETLKTVGCRFSFSIEQSTCLYKPDRWKNERS